VRAQNPVSTLNSNASSLPPLHLQSLRDIFINKLNLYLVYIKEYLFKFLLLIYYKLNKANFILDTLSRLFIVDNLKLKVEDAIIAPLTNIKERKLNMVFAYNAFIKEIARNKVYNKFNKYYAFVATLIQIALNFKEKFI
jgi:hypothetical protein